MNPFYVVTLACITIVVAVSGVVALMGLFDEDSSPRFKQMLGLLLILVVISTVHILLDIKRLLP